MLSPGWLFTEGMMMARDLVGWEVVLGLRGLLVEESESWESCTVTQLITLVLWLVPELQERIREEEINHFSKIKLIFYSTGENSNSSDRK